MQLSAVIPVYNGAPFVATTIESVLAQEGVELEVIVVDDGSTDETPEVLASFGDRIRTVRQENRGLSAARNSGLGAAQAKYIALVDADDTWEPTKSSKQIRYLEAHPDCALVFCDAYRMDAEGRLFGVLLGDAIHDLPTGRCLEPLLLGTNFVVMPGVMVRRSIFDQVGTFDETLSAVEDYDMWLRIAAVGEIGIVPEPLASYRQWPGQMTRERGRMLDCERRVLEKAVARHPELARALRGPVRRRFASLYDLFGYRELQEGNLGPALGLFLRAARQDPLWLKPYRHLLAVCLSALGLWRPRQTTPPPSD